MKVVVASDSFKGSLSSAQVADAVKAGIKKACPSAEVLCISVADGGEGTMEALIDSLGGSLVNTEVNGPLMSPVIAQYAILDDGITAVLEMSSASGLTLVPIEQRNPLKTTTYGTGELILSAISKGCRKFLVGIGGSATNDAGMGMLTALGLRFFDNYGKLLSGRGEHMSMVAHIDCSKLDTRVLNSEFIIACDVDTPFCGPNGAAYVFSPQKGATPQMVEELDAGMCNFAKIINNSLGKDIINIPGSGAAGGLGGGFLGFLNASLVKGVDMVLDAINFDEIIKGADLIITGEGRIDFQTLKGKTPFGVMKRAVAQSIPVWAIGGTVNLDSKTLESALTNSSKGIKGFDKIVSIKPEGEYSLEYLMRSDIAYNNIKNTIINLLKQ